jgi:hypothetical protein
MGEKMLIPLTELGKRSDLIVKPRTVRRMIKRGNLVEDVHYKRVGSGRGMIYLTEQGLQKVKSG